MLSFGKVFLIVTSLEMIFAAFVVQKETKLCCNNIQLIKSRRDGCIIFFNIFNV